MHHKKTWPRRAFIKQTALLGLGVQLEAISLSNKNPSDIQFLSPIDGDVLHQNDGIIAGDALAVKVTIAAPEGSVITVNGQTASNKNGIYTTTVKLHEYQNTIEIKDRKSGNAKKITVFRYNNLAGKYRLSIDDAVWFLKDIHLNRHRYQSIFENPFLAFLQQLHNNYGTKTHINIFYETEGFDLSQMTDQFKQEWQQHASWLQLSFHAKAEFPDNPYKNAGYGQVKQECEAVMQQIRRFAGDASVADITTLHWGEVPVEVSRALRDCGYTTQLCDFNVDDNLAPCSYYLTVAQRRHMNKRFVWHDTAEQITFVKSSIIIDTKKAGEIIPFLNRYAEESRQPPYVDLLVHEQYFYEHYHNYQPDYKEKVRACIQWAIDKGYKPGFFNAALK